MEHNPTKQEQGLEEEMFPWNLRVAGKSRRNMAIEHLWKNESLVCDVWGIVECSMVSAASVFGLKRRL
jgi:hypothetical protein